MIKHKINESFTIIEGTDQEYKEIEKKFSIEKSKNEIKYNIKIIAGIEDKFYRFYNYHIENNKKYMLIPNGLLYFLGYKEIEPEFQESEILEFIQKYQPFKLYDYQESAIINSILKKQHFIQAATNSGKSVIIGLIAKFLTSKKSKGLILVPNITLINQFDSDLKSYNLDIKTKLIGGDFKETKKFDSDLTISTWQSVQNFKEELENLDFLIVDEAHGIRGTQIFEICRKAINARYKIGLTGTLPEEKVDIMKILSIFGPPKVYITPRELIDRGLATPAKINILQLNYNFDFNNVIEYSSQLKKLKEYYPRTHFISKLVNSLKGNTLVLFQHTQHGFDIFFDILRIKNIEFKNNAYKDLTFQKSKSIYFINGLIDGESREIIRKIFQNEENAIIVGNFACLSTGTNIRNLHNLILGSPLKSYTTITQSIGRMLRKHDSKSVVNIFDIHDNIGFFKYQLNKRLKNSYNPEGYEIIIDKFNI